MSNLAPLPDAPLGRYRHYKGRWLTHRVPQGLFDGLLLAFAGIAALRLIGAW